MERSILAILLTLFASAGAAAEDDGAEASEQWFDRISFSGLLYLNYEDGTDGGEDFSQFFIRRAYLTAEAEILPYLSGRVTLDTSQDLEGQGRGDMEVRLKYAFGRFQLGDWGPVTGLNLEAGIVHMVWLDFEEHINLYRMRGPMFMERSGIFNSADFGLTLAGGFGPGLDTTRHRHLASKYAARHGSFAVGVYNGSGYHGDERNVDKVAEARLSWRPLPDAVPGLQLSGLAIVGDGNSLAPAVEPARWDTYNLFLSLEHAHGAVTLQYVTGQGNQQGTWLEPEDLSESTDFDGYSAFAAVHLGPDDRWRVIANLDRFERFVGTADRSFDGANLGVGYHLGRGNLVMLDATRRDWDDPDRDVDERYQVVLQLKF